MPVILRNQGFVFFFYSNDHRPIHIHVRGKGGKMKIQIEGGIELLEVNKMKRADVKQCLTIAEMHSQFIVNEWNRFFNN